jgi:hypothetical protein
MAFHSPSTSTAAPSSLPVPPLLPVPIRNPFGINSQTAPSSNTLFGTAGQSENPFAGSIANKEVPIQGQAKKPGKDLKAAQHE